MPRDSGIALSPADLRAHREQRRLNNPDLLDESLDESDLSDFFDAVPTPPTPTMANAAAIAATLKAHISLPAYSGRPKSSTFQGEKGSQVELYTARGWARRVDTVTAATGWSDDIAAQHAQLALLPNQPAGDWYQNRYDEPFMASWKTMKEALVTEFSPFINASDKVDILRSFSQGPSELSGPYLNRIQLQYKRFIEDLEAEFTGDPWDSETQAQKTRRSEIIQVVTNFHLASFFALGLHDSLLRDVTKANVTNLEEMLKIAKLSEAAIQQARRRHVIAEVSADLQDDDTHEDPKDISDVDCIAYVRSQIRSTRGGGRGRARGRGRGGARPGGTTLSCYFCFAPGHLANECQKRQKERSEGKWRDSTQDTPMSKADFDARPPRNQRGNRPSPAQPQAAVETAQIDSVSEEGMYKDFYSSKN